MKRTLFAILVTMSLWGCSQAAVDDRIVLTEHQTVVLRGPVTANSVAKVQADILAKNAILGGSSKPIYLFIDSPGGSIVAGQSLIELVKGLDRPVHTVAGFAASMGYQMVEALGTRYVMESTSLMSHRAAISGLSGQVPGEANTRLANILQLVRELELSTSKRLGITLDEYQKLIHDELWLTGAQAVAMGHADKLVRVSCAKDLTGEVEQTVETMFGPIDVTFHKCPLIRAPLKIKMRRSLANNAELSFKAEQEILRIINNRTAIQLSL